MGGRVVVRTRWDVACQYLFWASRASGTGEPRGVTGFLRNAYEGTRQQGHEILHKADSDTRLQDIVCLLEMARFSVYVEVQMD